jgi:uncharacterized protein (TIGR03435 family)
MSSRQLWSGAKRLCWVVWLVALTGPPVSSQATDPSLSFEAASLKRSPPNSTLTMRGGPETASPGRVTYTGLPLSLILQMAYPLERYQIEAPDWLGTEAFDIFANVPAGASRNQFRVMLRNLLAERLNLRVHREEREVNAFALVVGKGGAKMRKTESLPPDLGASLAPGPGLPARTQMVPGGGMRILGERLELGSLARTLSGVMHRPVLDRTGLVGSYDFQCEFVLPEASGPADGMLPDVFHALQDALGLRLEPTKATIEFLVIDHIEKVPRPN